MNVVLFRTFAADCPIQLIFNFHAHTFISRCSLIDSKGFPAIKQL
nr:MAG TPA: hypothetical protein [Bacteriophage sp.]